MLPFYSVKLLCLIMYKITAIVGCLILAVCLSEPANAVVINGSAFELIEIDQKTKNWEQMRDHAQAQEGITDLATFTPEEMVAIFEALVPCGSKPCGGAEGTGRSYFVGLFQEPDADQGGTGDAEAGWQWIDDTVYDEAVWVGQEPNQSGGYEEDWGATAFWGAAGLMDSGYFGFSKATGNVNGYMLERQVPVPEPSTLGLLGIGLLGLMGNRRQRGKV